MWLTLHFWASPPVWTVTGAPIVGCQVSGKDWVGTEAILSSIVSFTWGWHKPMWRQHSHLGVFPICSELSTCWYLMDSPGWIALMALKTAAMSVLSGQVHFRHRPPVLFELWWIVAQRFGVVCNTYVSVTVSVTVSVYVSVCVSLLIYLHVCVCLLVCACACVLVLVCVFQCVSVFVRSLEGLPTCRLRASGICPIPCVHPLPKSLLRVSVKMAFLVARIGAQKDPCVHPFQRWPLHASIIRVTKNQHLDPNIRNFGVYYRFSHSHRVPLSNPCLWGNRSVRKPGWQPMHLKDNPPRYPGQILDVSKTLLKSVFFWRGERKSTILKIEDASIFTVTFLTNF